MDTTRLILLVSLTVVTLMLMQKWEEDYGQVETTQTLDNGRSHAVTESPDPQALDLPDSPVINQVSPDSPAVSTSLSQEEEGREITVETDVYSLTLSLKGGGVEKAQFKEYPIDIDKPEELLTFFDKTNDLFYILQGGLLSKNESPSHESVYRSDKISYSMREGEDTLVVPLFWQSVDGVMVEKRYKFQRDSYVVDVEYRIQNNGLQNWQGRAYGQLQRSEPNGGRTLIYTYTGAVFSTPEKRYEKIDFDDMRESKLQQETRSGWIAMLQHYFVSALVPNNEEENYYYYTKAIPEQSRYIVGAMTPVQDIAPGNSGIIKHRVYFGPKTQKRLEKVATGLELTVDYGALWFIAKPVFICLDWFHSHTNNWGWAIILVTILIKLLFYPLSAAGYRSMANMRRVQPRLLNIRERYKNDKARLNQAMMDLYKKEKINPLGGCFPILIQIPVFIALYWVLLESVEMRQAPFVLWLQDLSSPDPWFILPLVMGVTMFIQQKLNPAPMDPMQEKIMSFLPIVFTIFFAFFPSGLVLYWVVNNILSIVQQARINHTLEKAGLK